MTGSRNGYHPFQGMVRKNERKKIIQQTARDAVNNNFKDIKTIEEKAVKELKEKGVNIFELPSLEPFMEKTQGVYAKYTAMDPVNEAVFQLKGNKARKFHRSISPIFNLHPVSKNQ